MPIFVDAADFDPGLDHDGNSQRVDAPMHGLPGRSLGNDEAQNWVTKHLPKRRQPLYRRPFPFMLIGLALSPEGGGSRRYPLKV